MEKRMKIVVLVKQVPETSDKNRNGYVAP